MQRLIFIHGRAQQGKDGAALKEDWIESWRVGLAASGLELPVAESDIRFPYYGDTLDQLARGVPAGDVSPVSIRSLNNDGGEAKFLELVAEEIIVQRGIGSDSIRELMEDTGDGRRGILNSDWSHAVLKAIDEYIPGMSSASIRLFTRDVYQYLRNPGIRDAIEEGVRAAFVAEEPTVVVAHSLGTVVAYNLLKREGRERRWNVPLLVTVGSPLGIRAIRKLLDPITHPVCVGGWFNAMDESDVVALYPLTQERFMVAPAITNKTDVHNGTDNRHGISGYLDDPVVARRIFDAIVA